MKILICDNERPARGELRYILEQLESQATIYEAKNGTEALEWVGKESIDVAFLDINMPGMSGLAVAAAILDRPVSKRHSAPLIVFATAYDVHAVRAFELAALDYVVKPISDERLAQTMVRVRKAISERPQRQEKQQALSSYLRSELQKPSITRLWGERENKNSVLVDYSDVMWVEADGKRAYIQSSASERLQLRYTMRELESRLADHDVIRVHKGFLVNLNYVAEVAPSFSGTFIIRMRDEDQTEIPMSRQYARLLKQRLGIK